MSAIELETTPVNSGQLAILSVTLSKTYFIHDTQRICFRFYQYLPMMETHVNGYQVKATPLQVTIVHVVS